MSLRTVAASPNCVVIEDTNLFELNAHKTALENVKFWHKFIINNVYGLKRNAFLKILFDHIKPLEIIPLCYTDDVKGAYFFARMCKGAIEKLCNDKLTIPNPSDTSSPFKLKITLMFSNTDVVKVDLTENLQSVLQKRLKANILCLSNFVDDPNLSEFIPLSERKWLAFVLNMTKNFEVKTIKLCGNEIKNLDAIQIMSTGVTALDLRQNLITDLEELKHLNNFNIIELWLEGNPLCDLYDEYNYVQKVTTYCPKIEKLDGFLLRQNGFPSFRRNFLCHISAYNLVDQFLGEYFPTYDARNLDKLQLFYHKNAMFSITAEFFQSQLSSPSAYIRAYKTFSRNLLVGSDELTTKRLYTGSSEIMGLFSILPNSEHDPYSFTVDVLYYTAACAIIVITGVFRELPKTERLLGFNRYFILENRENQYRISNEQMHVFNALTSQQITAFKSTSKPYQAQDLSQQNLMVDTFATITNLTKDWAKRFLEECHYNLKHAMFLFVDLYGNDRIPSQGFKASGSV